MVPVEKYPCFCGAGLKRFESKDGRGFLKCKDEMCTLFTPEEKYNNLMECYKLKVDKMFKPNNFPLCRCEEVLSLWVSNCVKSRASLFSVWRDGYWWQVRLFSMGRWQDKSEERLETTAEEDLCRREAEESDEMYKTTSIIWQIEIEEYRTVIFLLDT